MISIRPRASLDGGSDTEITEGDNLIYVITAPQSKRRHYR